MNSESLPAKLILASTSKYRKLLLQRLALAFDCYAPDTDETPDPGESPSGLVSRLATEKALSVSKDYPEAIVIGSDQLAVLDGQIIGKPGNHQAALRQLKACSSRSVIFLTAVAVTCRASGFREQYTDTTTVDFRSLETEEIETYLEKEKPYDCAGSFKSESLGVVLFERINTEDPSALIGLPLIQTSAMLRRAGLPLP
jgi:septum formation protein